MLSERHNQLLTAYVDGRLSQRRREQAELLLQKSRSARALVKQLQDNIRRLQELPKHTLEPEFAAEVFAQIGQGQPVPMPATSRPRSLPRWVGLAIAASLLFAVTAASYVYFTSTRNRPGSEPEAVLTFADFDRSAFQDRLAEEAMKGRGVHLDIAYQDGPQAVERLRRAFQDSGIKLLPGPLDGNGELLVFAENLSADELGGILQKLAVDEKQSHQFDVPQFQPYSDKDRGQVARSLGLKTLDDIEFHNPILAPTNGKRPASKQPATPKSKDRVAIVFAGANATSGAGQGTSPAIRDFLANRAASRRGTFPVVLVLRPARA